MRIVVVLLILMACCGLPRARAQATPAPELRVLLVGNSLTYTNNLPAILRAIGRANGRRIATETWGEPGGTLAGLWRQGHVPRVLRAQRFDVVVLQERGGTLACMASVREQRTAPCAASARVQREAAELARASGARTLLFATWSPDQGRQARLDRGIRLVATQAGAEVFDAAGVLAALKAAQPLSEVFPDGVHPSTQASLMLGLVLYRAITGQAPQASELRIDAPLLPVNAAVQADAPLESQAGLRGDGTVTVVPKALRCRWSWPCRNSRAPPMCGGVRAASGSARSRRAVAARAGRRGSGDARLRRAQPGRCR